MKPLPILPLKEKLVAVTDTESTPLPVWKDTCAQGLVCFEDYSPEGKALDAFWQALDSCGKPGKVCRIAWFGDSYVEGDIITGDLRDTLQTVYGGSGSGYIPFHTIVPGFRKTADFRSSGFVHSTVANGNISSEEMGPVQESFVPLVANSFEMNVLKDKHLNRFASVEVFAKSGKLSILRFGNTSMEMQPSSHMQRWVLDSDTLSKIQLRFVSDDLRLFGLSWQDNRGVQLDNHSIRGNSGLMLSNLDSALCADWDSLHHPDLIILQYGLNVASEYSTDFSGYVKAMKKGISKLKAYFPNTSIVIMGVGDRSRKGEGAYETMRSIPLLIKAQRKIAAETGIAFFDLFTAMGGENSMLTFVNHKPAWANKDYTHLNHAGGKHIAHILAGSILFEHKKHQQKKAYETQ